jgi:hypothetical protein
MHKRFCWGDPRERGHLEDLGLNERMTLKLIFKAWDRERWTALIWFRIETGGEGRSFKYVKQISVSTECGEILD